MQLFRVALLLWLANGVPSFMSSLRWITSVDLTLLLGPSGSVKTTLKQLSFKMNGKNWFRPLYAGVEKADNLYSNIGHWTSPTP